GRNVPPTIRVWPGEWLEIHYVNALPGPHGTAGHTGPMNITNLHFHGLSVSPKPPQDDVLDLIARPGQALDYVVRIPIDHDPGEGRPVSTLENPQQHARDSSDAHSSGPLSGLPGKRPPDTRSTVAGHGERTTRGPG